MSDKVTTLDPGPAAPRTIPERAPETADAGASGTLDRLAGRLEQVVANLATLRVTTVVGTVTAERADQLDRVTGLTLSPTGQLVASTSVNMLIGDSSTIIAPTFVENPAYKELHEAAVAKAVEVRGQTLTLLKEAYEAFKDRLHF
jgi:hypothetical protein